MTTTIHDGTVKYTVAEVIAYRNVLILREIDTPNVIRHVLSGSYNTRSYPVGTIVTIVRSDAEYVVRRAA